MKTGRDFFYRWKKLIEALCWLDSLVPKKINRFIFASINPFGGNAFIFLRYVLLRNLAARCGDNVAVFRNVFIGSVEKLTLGNNVSIHPGCYIDSGGGIEIGNDVSIAHQTSILSANHTWEDESIPIKYNAVAFQPVHIENDVWIGCGCRILCGVKIHSRSVVAAGAVVCKDVESHTAVGGVPARVLKLLSAAAEARSD